MGWPFEHWENGVCYFHQERWNNFRENLEASYPHNENHRRICCTLIHPRLTIDEVPSLAETEIIYFGIVGQYIDRNYSVIFEPYPRWFFSHSNEESYILIAEDGHSQPTHGEVITFYYMRTIGRGCICYFKNRYWRVQEFLGGHLGPHPAPFRPRRSRFRSIDDI